MATTNKEYQGFITEIKYEEDSISLIEYKIIEKMLESDEIMNEIREREAEFNKIAKDYNKKIKELLANLEYHKSKMNEELKDKEQIRTKVKEAGIVGLGGAGFPTAVKLSPPKDKPIDIVIINACECEPLLNADYRLLIEYADFVLQGAELVRLATRAGRIIIGIEDNKRDAYSLFKDKTRDSNTEVALLKTKYPQGAEKNLIYALLDREVPKGGLPFDVGVVVQNVGTVKAIWDAVKFGRPLYERALTVSGSEIGDSSAPISSGPYLAWAAT